MRGLPLGGFFEEMGLVVQDVLRPLGVGGEHMLKGFKCVRHGGSNYRSMSYPVNFDLYIPQAARRPVSGDGGHIITPRRISFLMFLHISYGIHMYQNRRLQIRVSTGVVYPRSCVPRPPDHLVHLSDELVDVDLPVTEVTTLNVVLEFPRPPAASGVGEFEGPQEVRGLEEQVGHEAKAKVKIHTCLKLGPAVIIS